MVTVNNDIAIMELGKSNGFTKLFLGFLFVPYAHSAKSSLSERKWIAGLLRENPSLSGWSQR